MNEMEFLKVQREYEENALFAKMVLLYFDVIYDRINLPQD
jgi:hypothetical protein